MSCEMLGHRGLTFLTMRSHCVPLPAAGGPEIMTFSGVVVVGFSNLSTTICGQNSQPPTLWQARRKRIVPAAAVQKQYERACIVTGRPSPHYCRRLYRLVEVAFGIRCAYVVGNGMYLQTQTCECGRRHIWHGNAHSASGLQVKAE